jgi:FkbM family methyltransferase
MNDNNLSLSWDGNCHEITPRVIMNINSIKYPFTLRNNSSDVPTLRQVFIRKDYDFNVAKQPKVLIDAGANIGLASIYFANKYPDVKIIAIEPEESNFRLLQENSAPYNNITPVKAALWNKNGKINLVDPGLGHWGFMTDDKNNQHKPHKQLGVECYQVQSITVDRIMDDYEIDQIDILKIDIEGAEKEVFSDTSAWIWRTKALIVELHERMKEGCNRSFYNGSNGFDAEWKHSENIFLSRGKYLTKSSN